RPGLHQPGKRDEPSLSGPNPKGLRAAFALPTPFVEARGWHERAAVAHGGAEGSLLRGTLRTCIDEKRHIPGVLCPTGYEAPADQSRPPARQVRTLRPRRGDGHQNRLGGCNVEAGWKIVEFGKAKEHLHFLRFCRQCKSSAHFYLRPRL